MRNSSRSLYFVIPPEDENLDDLLSAVAGGQLLMYHAPRQSGKTTRLFALCDRLGQQGKVCRAFSLETFARSPFDKFKGDLTLLESDVALLIDEFDLIASHPCKDDILRFLRNQHQTTGKACICIGSFEIFTADLSSANGSSFNSKKGIAASPFSRDQVTRLVGEFAVEYEVEVDIEVIDDIVSVTGGHRGLVTSAGYCLQLIVSNNVGIKQIRLADWVSREADFTNKIVASSSFTRQRARLTGYMVQDVYSMFIGISRLSLGNIGGDLKQLRLLILLSDIGVLLPADEGQSFRIGPPALQQLAHALIPAKRECLPRELDISSQESILKVLMTEALPLALSLRDGGAKKKREEAPARDNLPNEEAYCLAFAHMWAKHLDLATLRPQVKAEDANKPVDYVALFPGCKEPAVIKFVAHSRPGPISRHSTVLEHMHRVDAHYRKIVGPTGSLWVINIALKDVRAKFSDLSHSSVRTLHVFHSGEDPKDVEFVFK